MIHGNPDEILATALGLADPASRRAFLDHACAGNEALRQEVDSLLAAHERMGEFLGHRPTVLEHALEPAAYAATPSDAEAPGTRIGRYKLLQQIGEGGMGVVYMAEQEEPVRRRVALKIIKLGMDTRSVVARFEAERQALALMDHPNIARVLDGGATDTGRPYFVMELVQGVPITTFCDENGLNSQARLKLFVEVCQAIQSAHQKGVIHRDIKPSNVLVTLHDGVPVPKVIDFGIAKATNQKLTEKTVFTNFGSMIGTPAYMSPEQAEMSGLDVDTRSDIYSLGVLLYELLTGSTPFPEKRLRSLAYGEMQRVILQEEPEKPSTRLSTLDHEQKVAVARNRSVELPSLSRLLKGDLDWIVMRCLEKDRTRRYETANGLASDIQRHLGNEPVVARPASAAYRIRKLVRRNKVAFAAICAVAAAVLVGLGTSTSLFLKERRTRQRAEVAETAATRNAEANRLQLLRLRIETGARHLREGHLSLALSWFVQAYKLDRAQPDAAEDHQVRLASIFEQCPRPLRMWFHNGPVTGAKLSPDGKRVVSVTATESVLWDVESGRSLGTAARGSRDGEIVFTRDGARAVIGDLDHPFIWDLTATPPRIHPLTGGTQALRPQWHPDGRHVAALTGKTEAAIWDADGQRQHTVTHDAPAEVLAVGFVIGERAYPPIDREPLPPFYSETVLMTVDSAGVLRFWNPANGQGISQRELEPKSAPWQSAFFDQNYLLTIHNAEERHHPSHARVWSLEACRPKGEALGHDARINGGEFSMNTVLTWGRDGTARYWDAESASLRASPLQHGSEVTAAARSLNPRQTLLATGCADGTARVWVPGASKTIGPPMLHGAKVTSVSFGPALHSLLTGSADGTVRLWNIAVAPRMETSRETSPSVLVTYGLDWGKATESRAGILFQGLKPGEPRLFPVAWRGPLALTLGHGISEESQLALIGQKVGPNVEYEVYNPGGGTLGPAFVVPLEAGPMVGALSDNGARALVRIGNTVRVWDPRTGQSIGSDIDVGFRPAWPRFNPDGTLIALGDTKKVLVWDIAAGRERFPAFSAGGPSATPATSTSWIDPLQFDPAGQRLLTMGDVPEENLYAAQAWDLKSGQPTLPPLRHEASINFAHFSPDGGSIATCGDDRAVRLWDARTGQSRLEAIMHPDRVTTVCFNHDGKKLYSACADGFLRIWSASTGEPLAAPIGLPVPSRFRPYAFPVLGGQSIHHTTIYNVLWEVPRSRRPVEDWEAWAELLTGQRVGAVGERRSLTLGELREVWTGLSTRFPEECNTSLAQREAWNLWMGAFSKGSGHGHTSEYLNELVELRPDYFVHRWHRADSLKVLNDWRTVAADLRVAAQLKPGEIAVWTHLVMAELILGDRARYQTASAEMAQRLAPGMNQAYPGGWAVLAAYLPNPPEVLSKLLAYVEAEGPPPAEDTEDRNHDFHLARGALCLRLGRAAEAIEHLEKARSVHEGDRSVIGFLALAHQAAGNHVMARTLREQLRQRIDNDARLHHSGRIMDAFGARQAATLLLKEADENAK
jgi:WD40 repeat protein/tetratricopeptide (TPR) repeat protein